MNNLSKAIIKVGSSTLAMRGCEIIRANGMKCEMRKISDNGGKYGCIYSISVDEQDAWNAESLLRSSGIMIIP